MANPEKLTLTLFVMVHVLFKAMCAEITLISKLFNKMQTEMEADNLLLNKYEQRFGKWEEIPGCPGGGGC